MLFHASETQNIKILRPINGTHNKTWVYAAFDIYMSAFFLHRYGRGYTFDYRRNQVTGVPVLYELFPGAFDLRYKETAGSIYIISEESFFKGTNWREELVSEITVPVLSEIPIENVREYLLYLDKIQKIKISFFSDRNETEQHILDRFRHERKQLIKTGISTDDLFDFLSKHLPNIVEKVFTDD